MDDTGAPYPTEPLRGVDVEHVAWLQGTWRGDVRGEAIEEVWSAPLDGAMMGMFRWRRPERPFYELMLIELDGGDVTLRIKHFDPGLVGWEERERAVEFALVALEPGTAAFYQRDTSAPKWLVYRLEAPGRLTCHLSRDGGCTPPAGAFVFERQAGP